MDDIVEGVVRLVFHDAAPDPTWDAAGPDPGTSSAPYRLYNIGNDHPEEVNHLIALSRTRSAGRRTASTFRCRPGDVLETRADVSDLRRDVGFAPSISLEDGVGRFVEWYRDYHGADMFWFSRRAPRRPICCVALIVL